MLPLVRQQHLNEMLNELSKVKEKIMGTIAKTSNWLKAKIDGISNWWAPKPAWYKAIFIGLSSAVIVEAVWIAQDIAAKIGG